MHGRARLSRHNQRNNKAVVEVVDHRNEEIGMMQIQLTLPTIVRNHLTLLPARGLIRTEERVETDPIAVTEAEAKHEVVVANPDGVTTVTHSGMAETSNNNRAPRNDDSDSDDRRKNLPWWSSSTE
jgi:hypothetical protein